MARIRFKALFALGLALVALAFGTGAAVMAQQQVLFDRYTLPGDKVFPEGIGYQASTGDFFVSSTTDGTILRGNVGRQEAEVFIPGGTDVLTGSRGMKVDDAGRLYICAGPQGQMFVYDIASKRLLGKPASGLPNSFLNDVSIAPDGSAYATDSNVPAIYRVTVSAGGEVTMERWIDVSPTISYTSGFNLGGIDVSDDGRYIIAAQGNTGKLYRIEVSTKAISEVQVAGSQSLTATDGIWLEGTTLYVMRNSVRSLVTINMSSDLGSGTAVSATTDPSFAFPTTFAKVGDRLLVVNSQFDKRAGTPDLPFTVSAVPAPQAGAAQQTPTAAPAPVTPAVTPEPPATEVAPLPVVPTAPLPPATQPTAAPFPGMPTTGGESTGIEVALAILAVALAVVGLGLRRMARRGDSRAN